MFPSLMAFSALIINLWTDGNLWVELMLSTFSIMATSILLAYEKRQRKSKEINDSLA